MTPDDAYARLDAWFDAHPDGEAGAPASRRIFGAGPLIGLAASAGSADAVAYPLALRALESLEVPLAGGVQVVLVPGDVGGCALVVASGTARELVSAYGGSLQLEVSLRGRAGPAAHPDEAIDALEAAVGVLDALYRRNATYQRVSSQVQAGGRPHINVGRIEGGTDTDVVPGEVVFRLDRRMMPEERAEVVEREMRVTLQSAVAAFAGVTADVRTVSVAPPFKPQAGNAPMVEALRRHGLAVFGHEIPERGTPRVADARLCTGSGLPPVLYGTGESPDDRRRVAQVLARTLFDLLRTG